MDEPRAMTQPSPGGVRRIGPSSLRLQVQPAEWIEDRLSLLLEQQGAILDLISNTAELASVLSYVVQVAERFIPSSLCVIQAVDQHRQALAILAPTALPPAYRAAFDGVLLGDLHNPVGLALSKGQPVIISELVQDGTSAPVRELAAAHGLRSLWAMPILDKTGEPLGSFLLFFEEPTTPGEDENRILNALVALCRFAIQHDRRLAALQSADQRFTAVAASMPGVVYQRVVKPDGQIRYTYISDGATDLFGVTPEEILADPNALFDCHGPEYRENFRERLLQASRDLTMWDVEATIITRSGERKFTHAIARPHRKPDGTVVWDGVILDATRIKEAERSAAAAAVRTREAIVESLSQGFMLFDANDQLVISNTHYASMYNELRGTLRLGITYEALVRAEMERTTDDGVSADDRAAQIRRRLEGHARPQQSIERQLPSGHWVLIHEHRTADSGTVILHTDVTPLKEREAALARSNRELQDFASVASHDLQEPLRKIEAFGDQLRRKCGEQLDDNGRFYLERMEKAARRMRALIEGLLTFSRVSTKAQPFVACDLSRVIDGVLSDLRVRINETAGQIEVGKLPTIDADPTQMRQLLQNLIGNALKFHRADEPPKVSVTASLTAGKGTEYCEIRVADNGIGFDVKYLDRIFSIFQRLHSRSEFEGTGIGLATCRKIVERHGGTITAVSAPGEGATFIVKLPARRAHSEAKS